MGKENLIFRSFRIIFCFLFLVSSFSCGRVYFPIDLKTATRSERISGQQEVKIKLVSITEKSIMKSNKSPYNRMVVDASDLTKPARVLNVKEVIKQNFPKENDPGPYVIGVGDKLLYSDVYSTPNVNSSSANIVSRTVAVSSEGFINIYGIGSVKASGLTEFQLKEKISERLSILPQ